MWTILFLLLFFGLLALGMPIFLVLGACAAVLYVVSGEPLIGAAQVTIDHLNSSTLMSLPLFVMAAAFMRQGGVAKRWSMCRPRGWAAFEGRWGSLRWWLARCSRRFAGRRWRRHWPWERSCCRRCSRKVILGRSLLA